MRNLQVGDTDLMGNRFNGHDLHIALRAQGIESDHLVWHKASDDEHTFEIARSIPNREGINHAAMALEAAYSTRAAFTPFSYDLLFDPMFLSADVVHYHLIHNQFFDVGHLPILSHLKPTVWTLHDPWAITGHCVHPMGCDRWQNGCGDCPSLESDFAVTHDTTALNWEIKRLAIQQSILDVIVASAWLEERVRASPIFENVRVHRIPFGIDLERFRPTDSRKERANLNVEPGNVVLALRATRSIFKGLDAVIGALERLETDQRITLLIFGEPGLLDRFSSRFQLIELGWIEDEEAMVRAYNAADIFLMPSTAEGFGMMAMEAMACGKPTIVMSGTALDEVVCPHLGGGISVPQGDLDQFAKKIQELVEDSAARAQIGTRARELSEEHYDRDRYTRAVIGVYEQAIERAPATGRAKSIIKQQLRVAGELSQYSGKPRGGKPPVFGAARPLWRSTRRYLKKFRWARYAHSRLSR